MNDIKQLEERISQLTELVKTGSEAIKNMEAALKAAEEERDRLADQRSRQEPKFERLKSHEDYSYIAIESYGVYAADDRDIGIGMDLRRFENNNYFHTHERAQEVADKINFLLKLERLHDTFCPDYVPDWNSDEYKYFVFYDNSNRCYRASLFTATEHKTNVFFATKEIAQKVCDILNAELEEKSNKS